MLDYKQSKQVKQQGENVEEQLTTSQVARLLGVSDESIRQWIAAGKLPGYRITKDSWYRVNRKELEKFAAERRIPLDWTVLDQE